MLDSSLFVGEEVQERPVTLADGKTYKMYFKEYSGADFARYALASRSNDMAVRCTAMATLIAASLCDEKGKSAITFERACALKPGPMNAIFQAALEVNGATDVKQGKKGKD